MDDMSHELRALTESARRGDDPTDDDRARVRRALALKLGAAALTTGAASAGSTASAAVSKGVFAAWWIKVGVVALVTLSVATGITLTRSKRTVTPARVSAPVAAPRARVAPEHVEADDHEGPVESVVQAPDAGAAPAPRSATQRQSPSVREEASDLTEELAALRESRRAMSVGEPARAIEILDAYARSHRGGAMAVEREGARLIASCAAGRDVRAEAEAFVARHGDAPLASRVRAGCIDR